MRWDVVLSTVVEALAPDLGATMARASVVGIAQRLGLPQDIVSLGDALRLLDALEPGLRVFVGHERATAVTAAIRTRLEGGETP